MNLVQIATSVEHGAYYYDFLTCKIYHVPYEDLLNLNEVRFSNLLGWMLGSSMAMIGVIHYAQDMQLKQNFATLFFLVVGLVLSAAIIVWGIKRNQKRISGFIRERYRTVKQDLDLIEKLKYGQKDYVKIAVYIIFIFCLAISCLLFLVQTAEALFFFFFVISLDAGVLMIAILQPFGKIAAYFTIKKRGY